jgi:hypothetical protein
MHKIDNATLQAWRNESSIRRGAINIVVRHAVGRSASTTDATSRYVDAWSHRERHTALSPYGDMMRQVERGASRDVERAAANALTLRMKAKLTHPVNDGGTASRMLRRDAQDAIEAARQIPGEASGNGPARPFATRQEYLVAKRHAAEVASWADNALHSAHHNAEREAALRQDLLSIASKARCDIDLGVLAQRIRASRPSASTRDAIFATLRHTMRRKLSKLI